MSRLSCAMQSPLPKSSLAMITTNTRLLLAT
jgi:hypothetical protein